MDKQQLEAIRARDADDYAAADVLRNIRSAGNTDPELEATINMVADRHALLAAYDALAAENAALRKDAEARSFYDRTASAHGFVNAPHWNDLAEETRQMYRDERAKRDAAMGESHDE